MGLFFCLNISGDLRSIMKTFNQFISESKTCPSGKYYCHDKKKCMPIPRGYYVGRGGYLEKDDDSKKNGSNGNGNSNGGSGNGNGGHGNGGNGNGGGGE